MEVKVPQVKKCCFFVPLRPGILIFGLINIAFSLLAVAFLVITTELKRKTIFPLGSSLEMITSTILFSIFGMSVILNILLLVAGCQKDIPILRLYMYYAVGTLLAALIPTIILMSRLMLYDAGVALFAIAMQCYVIVLVRSEIMKLETQQVRSDEETEEFAEVTIVVPDTDTLL